MTPLAGTLTPLTPSARRPSFSPASLSGLVLWLDAADASKVVQSSGNVSQWTDKSGNGNHALQATGGNKPITGTHTINGKATISFDDASSYLTLTTPIDPHDTSGFGVASYLDLTGMGPILGQNGGSTYWGSYNSIPDYFLVASNGLGIVWAGSTAATAYGYTSKATGGDVQTLYIDGAVLGTGTNALGSAQFDTVGHRDTGEWFNGNLGEVILYNRVLNSTEIGQVSAYLRSKWGTP